MNLENLDEKFNQEYMQAQGTCPNCGTALTFIDGLKLAMEHCDLKNVIMCHNCGDIYTIELEQNHIEFKDKVKNIPVTPKEYSKRNFAKEFYNDYTKNDGNNGVQIFNDWTDQGHQDANYTFALIIISKKNGIGDPNTWELLFKKAVMTEKADDESLADWYKTTAEEAMGKTHSQINERISGEDKPAEETNDTPANPEKKSGSGFMNFLSKERKKPENKSDVSKPAASVTTKSEPTTGNPILDAELNRAYDNTIKERDEIIDKLRAGGVSEDILDKVIAETPSKEEFFKEFSNPKRIGIVFDIAEFDGGYGYGAFKIFYKNLDPLKMGTFSIFDGDTRKTLYENDNQYCIAIQTFDQNVIDYVKNTMSNADDKGLAPLNQRFIEEPAIKNEMLVYSADVRNGLVMSKSNNFVKQAADESANWKTS